jgi:hypothetical protein
MVRRVLCVQEDEKLRFFFLLGIVALNPCMDFKGFKKRILFQKKKNESIVVVSQDKVDTMLKELSGGRGRGKRGCNEEVLLGKEHEGALRERLLMPILRGILPVEGLLRLLHGIP